MTSMSATSLNTISAASYQTLVQQAAATRPPSAVIRSAALLGIGFVGRFDDIMAMVHSEGFQTAVQAAVVRMVDADALEGLIFPTLPLRIEAARDMTAGEARSFVRDYVERYQCAAAAGDLSLLHDQNHALVSQAVSRGNESVGYVLPVIAAFHREPDALHAGAALEASTILRHMLDNVQFAMEQSGDWRFNQAHEEIPALKMVAFDHFIPACKKGFECALDLQASHITHQLQAIIGRSDLDLQGVSIDGLNLEINLGEESNITFTGTWLRDERLMHALNVRVSEKLAPEIRLSRRLHDAPHTPVPGEDQFAPSFG